ncbi:hypothetical protein [Cohnella caldifontis]|uniref:hypothetical protein n=1 Tax=Cohnella caldifontis TaxID=3027471 RepID=UPI0023EC1254|nr:hypothetical protein [Cohnella sp. YIM B05605]
MENSRTRVTTIIFALALVLTVAALLLFDLPSFRPYHFGVTLASLFIAETAVYAAALYIQYAGSRFNRMVPGFAAYVAIAGLYFAAVLAIIVVCSAILNVSAKTYALIHLIAFVAGLILAAVVHLFLKDAEGEESDVKNQVNWNKDLLVTLTMMKQRLAENPESFGDLIREIGELEEKVRYSDPISPPALWDLDFQLSEQVAALADRIGKIDESSSPQADTEEAMRSVKGLIGQLEIRNRRVLQHK